MSIEYGTRPVPQRMRASDAEREQIATILRAAMTEGRLTLEEGEERLGAVYAAKFRDELAPFTADLPDGGRQALAETPEARAVGRLAARRRAGFWVAIAVVLIALWALPGAFFALPFIMLMFLLAGAHRHGHAHRYGYGHRYGPHHDRPAPWNMPHGH